MRDFIEIDLAKVLANHLWRIQRLEQLPHVGCVVREFPPIIVVPDCDSLPGGCDGGDGNPDDLTCGNCYLIEGTEVCVVCPEDSEGSAGCADVMGSPDWVMSG